MRERKKITRKHLQEKYDNLKIDTNRRMKEYSKKIGEAEIGAAQLQTLVDILMGQIIEAYGEHQEDGSISLYVPKSTKRYMIDSRVRPAEDESIQGIVYTAIEVEVQKDEQVQEHKDEG